MAARFTHRFETLLPDNESTAHIKCVRFKDKLFFFLPQLPKHEILVWFYLPELDRFPYEKLKITNPDIFQNDANSNRRDADGNLGRHGHVIEYEPHGLDICRTYRNGTKIRYRLDLEQHMWRRLEAHERAVFTSELGTMEGKWRLVERSANQLALEFYDRSGQLIQTTFVDGYQAEKVNVTMIMLHGRLHLVKLDRHDGKRSVHRVDDNGAIEELHSHKTDKLDSKAQIWTKDGKIFQFNYRQKIILESFNTTGMKWETIKFGNDDRLDNRLGFFEFDGKILMPHYRRERFSADHLFVGHFEVSPNLQTLGLLHFADIEHTLRNGITGLPMPSELRCAIYQMIFFKNERQEARERRAARNARQRPGPAHEEEPDVRRARNE